MRVTTTMLGKPSWGRSRGWRVHNGQYDRVWETKQGSSHRCKNPWKHEQGSMEVMEVFFQHSCKSDKSNNHRFSFFSPVSSSFLFLVQNLRFVGSGKVEVSQRLVQFRFSGVQNELQSALLKLVGAGSGAGGRGVVALPSPGLKVDMTQSLARELKDVLHGVLVSRALILMFHLSQWLSLPWPRLGTRHWWCRQLGSLSGRFISFRPAGSGPGLVGRPCWSGIDCWYWRKVSKSIYFRFLIFSSLHTWKWQEKTFFTSFPLVQGNLYVINYQHYFQRESLLAKTIRTQVRILRRFLWSHAVVRILKASCDVFTVVVQRN